MSEQSTVESLASTIVTKHMFVLGIDPGLTRTGYAVIESNRSGSARLRAVGVVRTSPDHPMAERLAELFDDLSAIIAEHEPAALAIESVFVNQNLQTATNVGRASGVAILAGARAGLDVHEFTPTSVKSAVTGYGNAPKEQVQKMVAARLGLPAAPQPADAADAVAVALCYLQSARMRALR